MKTKFMKVVTWIAAFLGLVYSYRIGHAADTCMFAVTADDMPPNIVLLIDNGAEMKHPATPGDYDSSVDYTPNVGTQIDVVPNGTSGNGFFNQNGYGIYVSGVQYYLVPVNDNLTLNTNIRLEGLPAADKKTSAWTINGQTVHLPAMASAAVDADGVKDNAGYFRYSKNYLNWLYFYTSAVDLNGDGVSEPVYDGAPLPDKSRFYYAKKALLTVGKLTSNKAKFGIYNFTSSSEGSSSVQPLGDVVTTLGATPQDNILDPNYINNINNMGTVIYSPLAEGAAAIGGYLDSPSSGSVDPSNYCQKNFMIVVTPGLSSEDRSDSNQAIPNPLKQDHDQDATDGFGDGGPGQGTLTVDGVDYTYMTNYNGSTYLDDIAHYFYTHDMRNSCDSTGGYQNISTYTVGFMATVESRLFLINTSNNGNGNPNLSNSAHPEYGKYHFDAQSAGGLSQAVMDAVNSIISRTSAFTAPVVPVTRTTSGNKIYMAFFKPLEENFWEGNVTKFGLSANNEIIGIDGNPATWPNGSMREDAKPYWATIDWADTTKSNYIHNDSRKIYTYLGAVDDLTDMANRFVIGNANLTAMMLGNPTDVTVNGIPVTGREKVINYIRGADVLDQDADGDSAENRPIITGDVLHSEPLVFEYRYTDISSITSSKTMVFYGANDGMLHAVLDVFDPDVTIVGDEILKGTEEWAFIPPNQLNRLKFILEGTTHRDYVDSSPKVYFHDVDGDGLVEPGEGDKVVLVCGQRKGGSSYFALDITNPEIPRYLWRIGSTNDSETGTALLSNILRHSGGSFQNGHTLRLWDGVNEWHDAAVVVGDEFGSVFVNYDARTLYFNVGKWLGNLTTAMYQDWDLGLPTAPFVWGKIVSITNTDPDVVIPELGQSWSEPAFGLVKTSAGDTAVLFVGGGYSADNSAGKAVIAVNVFTGAVVRKFTTAMNYSVPSAVKVVDEDGNGFVDKIYVGDLGGQLWRFGQVAESGGSPLNFPDCDENIDNWVGQVLFSAPTYVVDSTTYTRKFFYPPSVTLENGYDLVFIGTGDRENACDPTTAADRIYAIKDTHEINQFNPTAFTEADLVDVTNPAAPTPNLNHTSDDVDSNGNVDQGWYMRLVDDLGANAGEKMLAQGVVFYKTYYFTTFTPNNDPCVPGGNAKLYALNYLNGAAAVAFSDTDGDGDLDLTRSISLGGGIPSKPVTVITEEGTKLFISVGSTNPNAASQSMGAGIVGIDPLYPKRNFFYLWWREILN